jgi:lipopolysaccharide export system protein LptC
MNRLTTAAIDPQTARTHWSVGGGNAARAFRAARKHSRLVRILRIVVPLAVVLGITVITLITYFNPLRMLTHLPIDVGGVVVSGTKITMQQPRLSGFTRDARAYEMSADSAAQDLTKPDVLELRQVRATVRMQDKGLTKLTADTGLYNSKVETLQLDKNIVIDSSTGYRARLSEAQVDIHKGHVVSDHPVEVTMLQGVLNANRLEIQDSGALAIFDGGVTMTLQLNKPAAPKAKAATP